MNLETINVANSQPSFFNLSLLICQLFAGGEFRSANIFYHPEAFDDLIFTGIDLACPLEIPLKTFDISTPGSCPLNQFNGTDQILQLILLPQEQLAENFHFIKDQLGFYRIFLFKSIQESENPQWLHKVVVLADTNSNSLILIFDISKNTIKAYRFVYYPTTFLKPVHLPLKTHSNSENELFNAVLGEERYLGVNLINRTSCNWAKKDQRISFLKKQKFYAKLYFTHLNLTYINASDITCINQRPQILGRDIHHIRHLRQPIYNEFSPNFEVVDDFAK